MRFKGNEAKGTLGHPENQCGPFFLSPVQGQQEVSPATGGKDPVTGQEAEGSVAWRPQQWTWSVQEELPLGCTGGSGHLPDAGPRGFLCTEKPLPGAQQEEAGCGQVCLHLRHRTHPAGVECGHPEVQPQDSNSSLKRDSRGCWGATPSDTREEPGAAGRV